MISMEYRRTIVDGTEYNLITDEELEDLKVLSRNEKKLKKIRLGQVEGIDAREFGELLNEQYGL